MRFTKDPLCCTPVALGTQSAPSAWAAALSKVLGRAASSTAGAEGWPAQLEQPQLELHGGTAGSGFVADVALLFLPPRSSFFCISLTGWCTGCGAGTSILTTSPSPT